MLKIVTVLGARPQFIKAAVLSKQFQHDSALQEIIVHTGQHYDVALSEIFFDELGLSQPVYNLNIGSGTHGQQTGLMLQAIEQVLLTEQPGCVLVYGDTNSTLAGALAAAKLGINVIHVEAGLRSFNTNQPEEINRVLTDRLSTLLVAPSDIAARNLINEGISADNIAIIGDVMYDAIKIFEQISFNKSQILDQLTLHPKKYSLATIHRAENTNNYSDLSSIVNSLNIIAENTPIVFPLHPRTANSLQTHNLLAALSKNIKIIEPVGYLDMLQLTKNASYVVTDSGGLQKEAFYLQVPCIVLREETEWLELIELGWNFLASPRDKVTLENSLTNIASFQNTWKNPYGNGDSAALIQAEIYKRFK